MFFQPFGKLTLMRRSFRPLARLVLALVFAALFIAMLAATSRGHSWYPIECCSDRDCAPVASGGVGISAFGYVLKATGEVIPFSQARQSPDGAYHLCRSLSTNAILCFFAPPQGS